MGDKFIAWQKYSFDTCNELNKLRVDHTMCKISDATRVAALVEDICELTKHVPYLGASVDMSKELPLFLKGCETLCKCTPHKRLTDLF